MNDLIEDMAPKQALNTSFTTQFPPRSRTLLRLQSPNARRILWLLLLLLVVGTGITFAQYLLRPARLALTLNGQPVEVVTYQRTVGGLLRELGVSLQPQDVLFPPTDTPLANGQEIVLKLARRLTVEADGERRIIYTHAQRVEDVLRELDIRLGPEDMLLLNSQPARGDTPLPRQADMIRRPEGTLVIRRAMPILVDDDGVVMRLYAREPTLGRALLAEGIRLFEGDFVQPALATRVAPNLYVTIRRSKPATFRFDGQVVRTRTRAKTVGEALETLGVEVRPQDRVEPGVDTPITDNLNVRVVRVDYETIVESERIPFERRLVPDPNLELDTFEVRVAGEPGIRKREILVVYEDGQETRREVQREWVEKEPVDRVVAYGTKVVVRTIETPNGPVEYWRRFRMLATSYTAATSGKSRDHPLYGVTRTGVRSGFGIVAVDPRVVRLWSRIYVPGYGEACACDTGGAIKGLRIDLGYDENNLKLWYRWVDVYVLTPVPPPDQIRYIVPGMPVP
ncbi:MAG: ubiquitin-like domain-containing protein [Ardenticatenia bacterium]|nr:ubiquitin-like domain-containing protein [Ardenticatenia bacterium]